MEQSPSEKCLERLGSSLNALFRDPGSFINRVHPGDRNKYGNRFRDLIPELEVSVVLYDDNNRPRRDKIVLGTFVEYEDEDTSNLKVGLVVGCLLSRNNSNNNSPQDVILVVELPGESNETAKMPPPDSVCRIVPTTSITCKIDVEQKPPPTLTKTLSDTAGFVIALNSSFYGLDQDGTHTIGSFLTNLLSVARSRRGEMYATTENCRILSVELEKGRVRELASTRVIDLSRKSHHENEFSGGNPPIQIRGLCFAEGKPAAFDQKVIPGACQMYGIGKNVPNRGGDCVCNVSPSGRCDVIFELGRRDVVALAVVPIRLSASESPNSWSRIGPNDADSKAMRFIIWTEKGGLFVVDENRKFLQQLGGDLVRSLEITAVSFDIFGDLYAAGSESLYSVSPTGRVVDVAPLSHLPGKVSGICFAPREIAHPGIYDDPDFPSTEEPSKEEKSPVRSRSKSWWNLSRGSINSSSRSLPPLGNQPNNNNNSGVSGLLRLLRLKPKSTPNTSTEIPTTNANKQRNSTQNDLTRQQQQQRSQSNIGGSFSGKKVSNPLLPMEGTSMGETNRRGSGTLTRAPAFDEEYDSTPLPSSTVNRRQPAQIQQQRGPYFPKSNNDQDYFDDDDNDDDNDNDGIRPPSNPPPPNTRGADYIIPPSSSPPPYTARVQTSIPNNNNVKYRDVAAMLQSLGLTQYIADFRREELDMDLLASMWKNERDFKDMLRDVGVLKLGHREMIAHAVRQYQNT